MPVVARDGVNLVSRDVAVMPWYTGESVLEILESVYVGGDRNLVDLRLPVQYVIRGAEGSRALAGQVASGVLRDGDQVMALPSRATARVKSLATAGGDAVGFPPHAVTLTLDRDLDVGRGDLLVHPGNVPTGRTTVEAMVVWLDDTPLTVGRRYLLKHTTRRVPAIAERLAYVVDVNTLSRSGEATLSQHEIGRLTFSAAQPLFADPYARNRATGSFIVIDPATGATAAAGMIVDRGAPGRRIEDGRRRVVAESPAVPARRAPAATRPACRHGVADRAVGIRQVHHRERTRARPPRPGPACLRAGRRHLAHRTEPGPGLQPRRPRRERAPHGRSGAGAERRRPGRHRRADLAVRQPSATTPAPSSVRSASSRCTSTRRSRCAKRAT